MNFNKWMKSTVLTMGKHGNKPREVILKAIQLGLCANLVLHPINGYAQNNHEAALSYNEIKENLGDTSKRLNKLYGVEGNIIIAHNDENLRYLIANLKEGSLKTYDNPSYTLQQRNALEALRAENGYAEDNDQFKKIQLFTDLTNPNIGAFASSGFEYETSNTGPNKISFIRGWSEVDNNTLPTNFPYYSDLSEQKYYSFFHEMTHIVDTKSYEDGYSSHVFILKSEAIADLAAALIMFRETGNLDEYKYNIRPLRLAISEDYQHMTVEIVDELLGAITLDQVNRIDDKSIMKMSEKLVNEHVSLLMIKNTKGNNGKDNSMMHYMIMKYLAFGSAHLSSEGKVSDDYSKAAEYMRLLNRNSSPDQEVMMFSRDALVSSLNNLYYHNVLKEGFHHFVSALNNHVAVFQDNKVKDAFNDAKLSGKFDAEVFLNRLGEKLDVQAFNRRDNNSSLMKNYFQSVTGNSIHEDFSLRNTPVNTNKDVQNRYSGNQKNQEYNIK